MFFTTPSVVFCYGSVSRQMPAFNARIFLYMLLYSPSFDSFKKFFLLPLRFLSWSTYCLTFKYLAISQMIFFLLISSLILLLFENAICIIIDIILLKVLRVVLWPRIYTMLVKVPCALENVYSAVVGWSISISQVQLVDNALQVICILTDFLTFCLFSLSITERVVLIFPAVIVN